MEFADDEIEAARKAARSAASKWRGVEREDIEGQLFWWLCDRYKYVLRWRDDQYGQFKLALGLRREANTYCATELEKRMMVKHDPHYSPAMLKKILPYALDRGGWPEPVGHEHPQTGAPLSVETGSSEAMATLVDVAAQVEKLPIDNRMLLYSRFVVGLSLQELAARHKVTEDAMRKRVDRIVRVVSRRLGG